MYYRRRVQAVFSFSGVRYSLWVTDPVIEDMHLALADGVYNLDANYLTVSLSGPYLGRCYELVAAIMGGIRDG
jgi:putative nucleic acid modification protein with dual OB domain